MDYEVIKNLLERKLEFLKDAYLENMLTDDYIENFFIAMHYECLCQKAIDFSLYLSNNTDDILFLKEMLSEFREIRRNFSEFLYRNESFPKFYFTDT